MTKSMKTYARAKALLQVWQMNGFSRVSVIKIVSEIVKVASCETDETGNA
jgi:hypothetical protein